MKPHGFERDVEPYPEPYPESDAGVKARMMRMPVGSPRPAGTPRPRAERKSGGSCDLRASLGLAPAGPRSPEDRVRWSEDLTTPTVRRV